MDDKTSDAPEINVEEKELTRLTSRAEKLGARDNVTGEEVAPDESSTAELLAPALFTTFKLAAPNWKITMEESETLADAWAPVIDKYFPSAGGEPSPELAAIMATSMVLLPRLGTPMRKPDEEMAASPIGPNDTAPAGPVPTPEDP